MSMLQLTISSDEEDSNIHSKHQSNGNASDDDVDNESDGGMMDGDFDFGGLMVSAQGTLNFYTL